MFSFHSNSYYFKKQNRKVGCQMSYHKQMSKVLELQGMTKTAAQGGLTSNLSFICKEKSTISVFTCLPGQQ
ncbi:SapB/AmfS family lantipeptide [Bacillus cereus]|nr:SapB/AmfS family lantipeptide [Bacillus cereus]KAB2412564.1 SapB/AmfS family lantipeptide [Bacillus cereus]KAB2435198.1 SapB/AmfS family lantipeptide [Bacillus cereus]KAB2461708.1 SapB/AmfS family lantipeptide [Bacillus cereus]